MTSLRLKVDRVEESFAVCYLPDGGMTDIPLPCEIAGSVRDGMTIEVQFDDSDIVSVKLCDDDVDDGQAERRQRLNRLFDRK